MNRVVKFFAVGGLCALLAACGGSQVKGDGKIVDENHNVSSFAKMVVNGNFVLTVVPDQSQPSVQIRTDSNIQPYILTTTDKDILTIAVKKGFRLQPTVPINVVVNAKSLNGITMNGKSDLTLHKMSGDQLQVMINGEGSSTLAGKVTNDTIVVAGAATVNAKDLMTEQTQVKITGAGKVDVNVSKKLGVFISGAAQVTYLGQPPIINQEIYGKGQLTKAQQ